MLEKVMIFLDGDQCFHGTKTETHPKQHIGYLVN